MAWQADATAPASGAAEAPRQSRSVVVPEGFDPFEEPLSDADAAMPATESNDSSTNVDAYDPPGAADRDFAADDQLVMQPQSSPRGADDVFEVQDAFNEPGRVGPSVEEQLEKAQDAVEEEIERRDDEGPQPPADEADPFTPDDAIDAPDRRIQDAFEDPAAPDNADERDREFDEQDLDQLLQQQRPSDDFRPPLTPEEEAVRRQQLEKERIESDETCEANIAAGKIDNIKTVSLDIRQRGEAGEDYPFECGLGDELFQPRSWAQVTYLWKASGLCHKPLYFEQVQMERYGHSWGPVLDPVVSGAHFFGTLPVLPYKMGLTTPNECIYTLGYYRPGSCAPYMIPAVPFTWRAAAFEGAAWAGGVVVFP